jgi:glutaconate CoA-transferase subunit A
VDAVVEEPYGAHPSFAQGYYDRDNDFYVAWEGIGRSEEGLKAYLDEWVYGVEGRAQYMEKLGDAVKERLTPEPLHSSAVNYGLYR